MKRLFLILLILFMFSCVDAGYMSRKEIPFEMVNNLPIIEAKLNGISARFLVDSGASISALDLNAMYIYGYGIDKLRPVQVVQGIGGSQPMYYMKNAKFNSSIHDNVEVEFKGMDLRKFREDYGILGILGSDYLQAHDFSIDYDKKVIKIN